MKETRRDVLKKIAAIPILGIGGIALAKGDEHASQKVSDAHSQVESTGQDYTFPTELTAYINNVKVGNIENVTWTISVELLPDKKKKPGKFIESERTESVDFLSNETKTDRTVYASDQYKKGKTMIAGSMVFSQGNGHPLLWEIFKLTKANPHVGLQILTPFDLTIIGTTKGGKSTRAVLYGITVVQETSEWTNEDLGNAVGFSFVARAVDPWQPVEV